MPSHPSSQDRRARPRVRVAIDLELDAAGEGFCLLSRTVDMSSTGAFIRSHQCLPVGSPVRVAFHRGPYRNPLTLKAVVVRVGASNAARCGGMGVQFCDVTPLDEHLLHELISRAMA